MGAAGNVRRPRHAHADVAAVDRLGARWGAARRDRDTGVRAISFGGRVDNSTGWLCAHSACQHLHTTTTTSSATRSDDGSQSRQHSNFPESAGCNLGARPNRAAARHLPSTLARAGGAVAGARVWLCCAGANGPGVAWSRKIRECLCVTTSHHITTIGYGLTCPSAGTVCGPGKGRAPRGCRERHRRSLQLARQSTLFLRRWRRSQAEPGTNCSGGRWLWVRVLGHA